MKDRAFAKINLCLDVAGVRDDGYHDLKMIMVPIDFYDVLEMVPAEETSIQQNRNYLPCNEKNTIIKAIRVMQETYGFEQNFACTLQKHIPTRAGLAGGSADAASAIRMMNRMMHLHMSRQELIDVGKKVGADVPFCIFNQPSFVEGIGDILTPFYCNTDFELLLVKPRGGVSTKEAFAIVDSEEPYHPDCLAMKHALETDDYEGVLASLGNSLESAAVQLVSDIKKVKKELVNHGFDGVLMSGSGSTVFGISRDPLLVIDTMDEMKKKGYFVRRTKIFEGAGR